MSSTLPHSALDQLLDPVADCLTPEVAQRLISLRFEDQFQLQLDELATKASQGLLTADEHSEYEQYVEGIDLIGILKAKADQALSQ